MKTLCLPQLLAAALGSLLLPLAASAADAGPTPGVRHYIDPAPHIATIAGNGSPGSADGSGLAAAFTFPIGLAVDAAGTVFVADTGNNTIRRISASGEVSTLCGAPGTSGHADGVGAAAAFRTPTALVVDPNGNLYVADTDNSVIRQVSPSGVVSTIAGKVIDPGATDGTVATAKFNMPVGIARDLIGNLYVADWGNSRIRKITPAGTVSTLVDFVAINSTLNPPDTPPSRPYGIAVDPAGNVYFSEATTHVIRRVSPAGAVTTVAGRYGAAGSSDGAGTEARFSTPAGLALDAAGYLYVADRSNGLIRRVSPQGAVATLAGSTDRSQSVDAVGAAAGFNRPLGIAVDARGNVHVADWYSHQIRRSASQPVFLEHPAAEHYLRVGGATTLTARVAEEPVSLQWRRNGVAIPGATSGTHGISKARLSDAGTYELAASNAAGTILSRAARIEVFEAITITRQPEPILALVGDTKRLDVIAAPADRATYAWHRNGSAIPGATAAALTLTAITAADAGDYMVRVSNPVSSADSVTVRLALRSTSTPPPPDPTPTNPSNPALTAPTITSQPAAQSVTVGASAQFTVAAGGSAPFTFQWRKDGAALAGATGSTLALANVQLADTGGYSVTVGNRAGSVTSAAAVLTVRPAGPASRLSNLSIRTRMAPDQTVIVGLAVAGGARDVLVRAVGPALAGFGLSGAMADPRLELFRGQTLVLGNDNWAPELAPTFASVGAFALPRGSRDAAIRQNLDGAVSLQARGTGPGIVLLEAYDLGEGTASRLVNVSARNRVGSGDDLMIAGFNITGTEAKRILLRAVGPGLAVFGVAGTLADPVLELYAGANLVAANDNWTLDLAAEFATAGAFALPSRSRDAALVVKLAPGTYTAQVRGADGTVGEALVEIYELP